MGLSLELRFPVTSARHTDEDGCSTFHYSFEQIFVMYDTVKQ